MGVGLFGIGTAFGAAEFTQGYWPAEDFFVSPGYEVYKRMKGITAQSLGGLSMFWSGNLNKARASYKDIAKELGQDEYAKIKGNFSGTDPFLGATLVVGPGNVLHFAHFQAYAGDHASNQEILDAVQRARAE